MAHKKKIEVSGLNIRLTTKDHSPEDYVKLLKFVQKWVFRARLPAMIGVKFVVFDQSVIMSKIIVTRGIFFVLRSLMVGLIPKIIPRCLTGT